METKMFKRVACILWFGCMMSCFGMADDTRGLDKKSTDSKQISEKTNKKISFKQLVTKARKKNEDRKDFEGQANDEHLVIEQTPANSPESTEQLTEQARQLLKLSTADEETLKRALKNVKKKKSQKKLHGVAKEIAALRRLSDTSGSQKKDGK